MSEKPFTSRRIALYVLYQVLTLIFCWGWFAALWSLAFFNFNYDQIEWWLLFGSALAALYGLRPNLERAIDSYWLDARANPALAKEKAAQLLPIKRRIDLIFSVLLFTVLAVALVVGAAGWMQNAATSKSQ